MSKIFLIFSFLYSGLVFANSPYLPTCENQAKAFFESTDYETDHIEVTETKSLVLKSLSFEYFLYDKYEIFSINLGQTYLRDEYDAVEVYFYNVSLDPQDGCRVLDHWEDSEVFN